jgi:hypothetical protein
MLGMEDNWNEFYPDAEEELPFTMPTPKGNHVRIMVFVVADHAHYQLTRRSVTGIIQFINNTPVKWMSTWQKTVEKSTYGSELLASRFATEMFIEVRYNLRMLGVPIDGPALMLGDT